MKTSPSIFAKKIRNALLPANKWRDNRTNHAQTKVPTRRPSAAYFIFFLDLAKMCAQKKSGKTVPISSRE
jgi:hypothetical protein